MKSTPWAVRFLHAVLLLASGAAIATALSDRPMRWFIRGALLVGGLVIGIAAFDRLRPVGSTAANRGPEPRAAGIGPVLRWGWNALVLIFWSKVLALVLRYLGRDALQYFRFEETSYGPMWPRRG